MYYKINEDMARRAKEANSYSDYKDGSATAGYKSAVDEVREIAEKQKKKVDSIINIVKEVIRWHILHCQNIQSASGKTPGTCCKKLIEGPCQR